MQIKLNIFIIYRCLRHMFLRLLVFSGGLIIVLCLSVQRGAKGTFSSCLLLRNTDVRGAEG